MTVRVTTLKGSNAGAYYVDQLPNYYLLSGEPHGIWLGDAAKVLTLTGEVADDHLLALMAGMDPHHPDHHLGRVCDEKAVRGFDLICSEVRIAQLTALIDVEQHRIDKTYESEAAAVEVLRDRPRLDARVAQIDEQLAVDLRARTRVARLEEPRAIVGTLGRRPRSGAQGQAWDRAAGQLAQHQAAFGIDVGLGPEPGWFDNTLDAHSHRAATLPSLLGCCASVNERWN